MLTHAPEAPAQSAPPGGQTGATNVGRAAKASSRTGGQPTATVSIIVSYDGTPNDDDALALGRALARGGAALALAYVRHSQEFDPRREELAEHDAQRRLEQGASWLNDESVTRHVVVHPSTWEGLAALAAEQDAAMIVFGSDYRTPPGSVSPGTSAQHLLEGGPVAVAVAPAGIRTMDDFRIGTIAAADEEAQASARVLAESLGAEVLDGEAGDLVVVGSAPGTATGRIGLSGTVRNRLSGARGPVVVVPAGTTLRL